MVWEGLNIVKYDEQFHEANPWFLMLEINGKIFSMGKEVIGYRHNRDMTPIYQYVVEIANDFNPTGKFRVQGKSIKALMQKLAYHQYKIVQPKR